MSTRKKILAYLKTHDTFETSEIAKTYGLKITSVQQATRFMERSGVIVLDRWRCRNKVYRLTTEADKIAENMIFRECRLSGAMQRILCFYRALPAADVFGAGRA